MNASDLTDDESYKEIGFSPEVGSMFDFVITGIILSSLGILGLIGNLISIFILSRPQMKGSTNYILIGLATSDSILIITSILMFGLPALSRQSETGPFAFYTQEVFPYVTPIVYPIGLIVQSSSVYLTLLVTMERYVAVCSPLTARSVCTYGRARICVLCIAVASTLYNIPRFLEVTWVSTYDQETGENRTEVQPTALRQNSIYISIYITWLYLVVMYIVPFVSLAALNLRIYIQIRHSQTERAKLTRQEQREIGMATMLICVVIVFFVCNVLALVVNLLELMSMIITPLTQVSNLLVTINSSVNFIIYIIYGEKFQRLFLLIFCKRHPKRDQILRRYTTSTFHGTRPMASTSSNGGANGRLTRIRYKVNSGAQTDIESDIDLHSAVGGGGGGAGGGDIQMHILKPSAAAEAMAKEKEDQLARKVIGRRKQHFQEANEDHPDAIVCGVTGKVLSKATSRRFSRNTSGNGNTNGLVSTMC